MFVWCSLIFPIPGNIPQTVEKEHFIRKILNHLRGLPSPEIW